MHIQYEDTSLNTVKTRYYNSQFMGKAAAKDVLKTLKNVSMVWMKTSYLMDGPNVKASFLTSLNEERMDQG